MPMTSKEIIKLLENNGFVCVRQNGSHKFYINVKTKKMTTVPIHNKDLPKGTEQKILKDAGLK
ncbi:MAG: type II toxin-antitoxin system HicA family toxin [Sedimentibacter sp.]